jgi:hypothetical protein
MESVAMFRLNPVVAALLGVFALGLGGCLSPAAREHRRTAPASTSASSPSAETARAIEQLAADLKSLGRHADAYEARWLAETAVKGAITLAGQYRAVRPAGLQNVLVNSHWKSRGLCYHWANDLEALLAPLPVQSFQLHRAVSGLRTRHEHNALVVTLRGQPLAEGIVLDAWRKSGRLFWCPVPSDPKYVWKPAP